jgi:prolyl-tRNA synthetase
MLWSKLFIPTLRDEGQPLLTRAGYMRGPAYLYLAHRTLRKIEEIVREEMNAIGAQEFGGGADLLALARELRSYRQLPQIWHRITESYSFELGDAGYQEHFIAYSKILERCRVKYVAASGGFFPGEAPQDDSQGCQDPPGDLVPEEFYTPRQKTIADIAKFTACPKPRR